MVSQDHITVRVLQHEQGLGQRRPARIAQPTDAGERMRQEITEGKRTKQASRESEVLFRTVADFTYDWEYWIGPNGVYKYVSPSCERITGYSPEEFIATPQLLETIVHPDDREMAVRHFAAEAVRGGQAMSLDFRIITREGDERWIGHVCQPVRAPDGRWLGRRVSNRDITEQVLVKKRLDASRQELRDLSAHLRWTMEEERSRVAKEIYDELAQVLTVLKMDVSWLGKRLRKEGQPALEQKTESMSRLIDATIHTAQRIASELRPQLLDDLGLAAAIEWQVGTFQDRSGVTCSLIFAPKEISAGRHCSTAAFRILQEALTNVARHSRASEARISLMESAGNLVLQVTDDGRGISNEQIRDHKSLGLVGMRERARSLGGSVSIRGMSGIGTTLTATFPLADEERAR